MKLSLCLITIIMCLSFANASYIEVNLNYYYEKDLFLLNNTRLFQSNMPGGIRDTTNYKYVYSSINKDILKEGYIIIPGPFIIEGDLDNNLPPEIIMPNETIITLYLDYNPKLKNVVIYNNETETLNVDLMQHNRCNLNSICDSNENKILCPEDCPNSEKDGICYNIEDGICKNDPDCEGKDPDCIIQEYKESVSNMEEKNVIEKEEDNINEKPKTGFNKTAILVFIISLIVLAFFFIYYKTKKQKVL